MAWAPSNDGHSGYDSSWPDAGAVFKLRPSHSLSICQIPSAVFTFVVDLPPFSAFSSLYYSTIMEGIFLSLVKSHILKYLDLLDTHWALNKIN